MASLMVDAAGYPVRALTLRQVAPVARSCRTMPMEPGTWRRDRWTSWMR